MSRGSVVSLAAAWGMLLTGTWGCLEPIAGGREPQSTITAGTGTPASRPIAQAFAGTSVVVLEPSPGRPVFIGPGEKFYCLLRASANLGKQVYMSLVHADVPDLVFSLRSETPLAVGERGHGAVVLEVPPETPDGLYDLHIRGGDGDSATTRHCVRVIKKYKSRFRFVHLSDMNIGDPSAPEFDDWLVAEINLLAPEFIVATGDYTDWAYLLNKPEDWRRILSFFARFDAPAFLVCGDQDHEDGFTMYVANSPVGSFSYGSYHGILLLDHSRRPIDDEQVKWLRKDLEEHRDATFSFIVTHSDDLTFLDEVAREVKNVPQFLSEHKVRMVFVGGHEDWDYQEYAGRLRPFDTLQYIRTHQSSTCLRGRSTGVSHYRVIEVDGESVRYTHDLSPSGRQESIPVGRLRVFLDGANDGTSPTVTATIQNSLNQVFEDCRLKLRVAKHRSKKETEPVVAGGRLIRTLDTRSHWLCEVRVDLPDKGGVRVMASSEDSIPPPLSLEVAVDGEHEITLETRTTEHGLQYFESQASPALVLTNRGEKTVKAWPVVRLDGNLISIDRQHLSGWPVALAGGQKVRLPLRLRLSQAHPGPHLLQVLFLEDPLRRLTTFPVTIKLGT